MRDFFLYIKDTVQELEEEIDAQAGDEDYTEQQVELLYLLSELDNIADEALRKL